MPTLEDLDYFVGIITGLSYEQQKQVLLEGRTFRAGDLYCPRCGGLRKVFVAPIFAPKMIDHGQYKEPYANQLTPSLFHLKCVQDDTEFTALIYHGPGGPALAVFPMAHGGLTTPHSPRGVAYYLDQAHGAKTVGKYTAAMAMYRGALEHLLFEQGYTVRMLGPKIGRLLEDVEQGRAPEWAMHLEPDVLQVLKNLGDGSIHPNDGNVDVQAELDVGFLNVVEDTFRMLLFLVYEAPTERQARLETLRAKAQLFKGKAADRDREPTAGQAAEGEE